MLFPLNVWGRMSSFLWTVHMQFSNECPYTDCGKAEVSGSFFGYKGTACLENRGGLFCWVMCWHVGSFKEVCQKLPAVLERPGRQASGVNDSPEPFTHRRRTAGGMSNKQVSELTLFLCKCLWHEVATSVQGSRQWHELAAAGFGWGGRWTHDFLWSLAVQPLPLRSSVSPVLYPTWILTDVGRRDWVRVPPVKDWKGSG